MCIRETNLPHGFRMDEVFITPIRRIPAKETRYFTKHSQTIMAWLKKGKGMVLYSAVSSPLDRSKRFTLSSPGRPVHSNTNSASLGSILAMQQLRNDYTLTFPPLSIARYSFIQLSRLRRREVNENAQTSKR